MKNALFLDRDGTIIEDRGYIYKKDDLVFIKGSIKALFLLQKYYDLYVITNQAGIGEGFFSEEQYMEFNKYFLERLKKENIKINRVFHCPHAKDVNCLCRKPSDFFIRKICEENPINLGESWVIGDHPHDINMGKKAGTKTIYLLSGHGAKHFYEKREKPDFTTETLWEASQYILMDKKNNKI